MTTTRRRFRRISIAAAATAVVTLVLVALAWRAMPQRLEVGEIVREPGQYLSPRGEHRLIVARSDDRMIYVKSEPAGDWQNQLNRIVSRFIGDAVFEGARVAPGQEWFVCFDESDRRWEFYGLGGPNRKQAVCLHGPRSTQLVTFTADWKGVPQQFLREIPRKDDPEVWDDDLPPIAPPQLTATERSAAAASGP